jgi:hypothetical protein
MNYKKYAVPYEESGEIKVELFDTILKADEFIMRYDRKERPKLYQKI